MTNVFLRTWGGAHLRLRLGALEEVERWVLRWGTHATILKPDLLADRVGNIVRDLVHVT